MISPKKAVKILRICAYGKPCSVCPLRTNCQKGMSDIADLIQHMDSIIKKHKEEQKIGKTADHQA